MTLRSKLILGVFAIPIFFAILVIFGFMISVLAGGIGFILLFSAVTEYGAIVFAFIPLPFIILAPFIPYMNDEDSLDYVLTMACVEGAIILMSAALFMHYTT